MTERVRLIKAVEDVYVGGDSYEHIIFSKVSEALTKRFLPHLSHSPLKGMLLKELGTIPTIQLFLNVRCESGSDIITAIDIGRMLADSIERDRDNITHYVRWDIVDKCIEEYFQSVNINVSCRIEKDIKQLVKRLQEEIPIINEYIIIEDEDRDI